MLVIRMCLRRLALVVVLVLGADAVTLGASQETTHVKGVTPLRNAQQDFDMPRLVADIRTAVAVRMPRRSLSLEAERRDHQIASRCPGTTASVASISGALGTALPTTRSGICGPFA